MVVLFDSGSQNEKDFSYLSIFNRNFMKNIFKEPHYGVPGIILLPFEDARNLWHEVREKFNSKLEYTVYHWPFYWDVVKIAKENELDVSLFVNEKKIKMFFYLLKGYKKRSRNFDRRFKNNLDKSPIPDHYKVLIDKYVNEYLDEFKRDHEELMKRKSKKKLNYL